MTIAVRHFGKLALSKILVEAKTITKCEPLPIAGRLMLSKPLVEAITNYELLQAVSGGSRCPNFD